jgi:uncharacterized protein (TIGR01777 family)
VSKEIICIAGGTGLVGNKLVEELSGKYTIHILTRSPQPNLESVKYFKWNPSKREIDIQALHCDHIINLTGAGIADKRWTDERKALLISSRVQSNETLYKGLKEHNIRVKSIICASAIGYYGDRKDEILEENSSIGSGFLSDCSKEWEESSLLLKKFSNTFNILRIGIVLSTKDGALPKMLMTKNIGMLTYFGDGSQFYSWIHIEDLTAIFGSIIQGKLPSGMINAVSPKPLTNKEMTRSIASSLGGIPLVLPAPAFGLRIGLGEMADVVLNSTRVIPKFLQDHGFTWKFDNVGQSVKDLVERNI